MAAATSGVNRAEFVGHQVSLASVLDEADTEEAFADILRTDGPDVLLRALVLAGDPEHPSVKRRLRAAPLAVAQVLAEHLGAPHLTAEETDAGDAAIRVARLLAVAQITRRRDLWHTLVASLSPADLARLEAAVPDPAPVLQTSGASGDGPPTAEERVMQVRRLMSAGFHPPNLTMGVIRDPALRRVMFEHLVPDHPRYVWGLAGQDVDAQREIVLALRDAGRLRALEVGLDLGLARPTRVAILASLGEVGDATSLQVVERFAAGWLRAPWLRRAAREALVVLSRRLGTGGVTLADPGGGGLSEPEP